MTSFVYRPDDPRSNKWGMLVKSLAGPKHSSDQATYVITDEMAPTRHMATGEMMTSKSKFSKLTRSLGYVEVGNETATMLKPRKPIELSKERRIEDIKRTIHELRNR